MKIHTGDTVIVISGKYKGKQGTVMRVLESKNRLVVEGINMRTRHIKKTAQGPGSRIQYEASLHASNVMILDPKTKKPTRIGYKIDAKTGAKQRIALASGEVIAKAATTKATKKGTKTTKTTEATETKKEEKKTDAKKPEAGPGKTPFWKRGGKGKGDDTTGGSTGADAGPNVIQTAHRSQGG